RDSSGVPKAGATVLAFDRGLRHKSLLGKGKTDGGGRYEIHYSAKRVHRVENGTADLQIVVDGAKDEAPTIRFNAGPEETIDVVVPASVARAPSEYERLIATLTPLLQGVPLDGLTGEDVTFVAGHTGEDRQHLEWLSESAKLAQKILGSDSMH